MSAYTTITISRQKAKEFLTQRILNGMSDSELENLLDEILGERLYNVIISGEEDGRDDNLL